MPLIQVAGATPALSTTEVVTLPVAITTGNFGFTTARFASSASITSVTDNLGGTWTVSTAYSGGGAGANAFAYRLNCPSGITSVTWTFSVNQTAQLNLAEFSNVLTASAIDQTSAGATGTSTTPLSDSVTTTHANELVLGVISMGATETYSQSGSWSIASGGSGATIAPTARAVIVYQEVTSTGTYAATVTGSASALWIAQTVSFQQSGGAAPQDTPELYGRPNGIRGQNQMHQLLSA